LPIELSVICFRLRPVLFSKFSLLFFGIGKDGAGSEINVGKFLYDGTVQIDSSSPLIVQLSSILLSLYKK
jgi:hypothetical protein